MTHIHEKKKHFILPLKENRSIALSEEEKEKVGFEQFHRKGLKRVGQLRYI